MEGLSLQQATIQGQDSIHTLHMHRIYNGVYTVHAYVCLQGHCCFSTHTDATASEVMQHTPCTLMQWSLYIHALHTVLCICAQILAISGTICVQVVVVLHCRHVSGVSP